MEVSCLVKLWQYLWSRISTIKITAYIFDALNCCLCERTDTALWFLLSQKVLSHDSCPFIYSFVIHCKVYFSLAWWCGLLHAKNLHLLHVTGDIHLGMNLSSVLLLLSIKFIVFLSQCRCWMFCRASPVVITTSIVLAVMMQCVYSCCMFVWQ